MPTTRVTALLLASALLAGPAAIAQDSVPGSGTDILTGVESGGSAAGGVNGSQATERRGTVGSDTGITVRSPRYGRGLDGAFDSGTGLSTGSGVPSTGATGTGIGAGSDSGIRSNTPQ